MKLSNWERETHENHEEHKIFGVVLNDVIVAQPDATVAARRRKSLLEQSLSRLSSSMMWWIWGVAEERSWNIVQ